MKTCESNWKNRIREENMVSASRQAWLTADYIHTGWSPLGLLTSKSNGVQRNVAHTHTHTNQNQQMTFITRVCWRMRDGWEPPSYDRWYFGQRIVILTRIESSEEKTTTRQQQHRNIFGFYLWGFVTVSLSKGFAVNFDAPVLLNTFLLRRWITFFFFIKREKKNKKLFK